MINKFLVLMFMTVVFSGISGCCPWKDSSVVLPKIDDEGTVMPSKLAGPFRWELYFIKSEQVDKQPDGQRVPYIRFDEEKNRAFGFSGCNRFTGGFTAGKDSSLTFSHIASTKMACKDMHIEQKFLQVLSNTRSYKFIIQGRLQLIGHDSDVLAEFAAIISEQ
ncbi:META domain-containing protein [Desulfonatronovibrio magnus]|uniref:META domain-containing protein n=1 Tax=Desulfonatronovibrio magnus TaxID=698827 RepID=UPI0005EAE338|nr:META domain-containing protein [Desulfonatronovibrio magnus]